MGLLPWYIRHFIIACCDVAFHDAIAILSMQEEIQVVNILWASRWCVVTETHAMSFFQLLCSRPVRAYNKHICQSTRVQRS